MYQYIIVIMGKNHTIYFHDDVESYIEDNPTFPIGKVVNEAIRDYFSKDEDTLRKKRDILHKKYSKAEAELENCISERLKQETANREKQQLDEDAQKRKDLIEKAKQDWADGKISDEEYWKIFDGK